MTSAYRITPLAPKFVNRSSMFAEITYELINHASAQTGGFTATHHTAPTNALSCEHQRLQGSDNEAGNRAHEHQLAPIDAVVD